MVNMIQEKVEYSWLSEQVVEKKKDLMGHEKNILSFDLKAHMEYYLWL